MTRVQHIVPDRPATISYEGSLSSIPSQGSQNFSVASVPTGSAAIKRRVIQHLTCYNAAGSDLPLLSATIGGAAAAIHVQQNQFGILSAIISARLDAGTTATCTYNFTAGGVNYVLAVNSHKGMYLRSAVAYDTDAAPSFGTNSADLSINVKKDGILIYGGSVSNGSLALTGVTENYEIGNYGAGAAARTIGGTHAVSADEINRIVNTFRSGGTFSAALVAASFR